jgi:hypothetical protein
MSELAFFVAALAAAYCGFALLALAMAKHWRQAMGPGVDERAAPQPRAVLTLRATGSALFVVSLAAMIYGNGPGFGVILWVLSLSVSAYGVVATLALKPYWLRPIACLC